MRLRVPYVLFETRTGDVRRGCVLFAEGGETREACNADKKGRKPPAARGQTSRGPAGRGLPEEPLDVVWVPVGLSVVLCGMVVVSPLLPPIQPLAATEKTTNRAIEHLTFTLMAYSIGLMR
ncbi:hypothetical protein APY94_05685 [Thermococcus celericrescens]|uniref:Uncharacterized protein n=1 Tax=Thermococcus celericrescens TaxID=227598 RepID=A0A117ITD5_9EURY|nr:hypothetical protein [Thermococcus celericrescens]KUH33456.1 hypothetical protein APY94_05685 [Thermococcus celericrescens]